MTGHRAGAPTLLRASRARRGAGITEVILAIVIFALIATSYAAVTLRYSTRMKTIAAGAARSAAIMEAMNRLMAVPFDSLSGRAGTVVTTTGSFPNTRTITVSGSGSTRTVTLIVTPAKSWIKPDTVVLTRARNTTTSPLG